MVWLSLRRSKKKHSRDQKKKILQRKKATSATNIGLCCSIDLFGFRINLIGVCMQYFKQATMLLTTFFSVCCCLIR